MSDHEMTIIPESFEENFVICSRYSAQDDQLSFAAKGLLWNLLSRPKNWIIHTNELATIYKGKRQRGNGADAIEEMLKELKEQRYIYYKKFRLQNGQFKHIYRVFHTPYTDEKIQKMFPEGDYPPVVNPALVNPPIYKGDIDKGDKEENIYNKQQQPLTPSSEEVVVNEVVVQSKDKEEILRLLEPHNPSAEIKEIALNLSPEKVKLAVLALEEVIEAKTVGFPLGFLRRALEKGWGPNDNFYSKQKNQDRINSQIEQNEEECEEDNNKSTEIEKIYEHKNAAKNLIKEFHVVKDQFPGKMIYDDAFGVIFADYNKSREIKVLFNDLNYPEKVIDAKKLFKEWD